MYRHGKFESVGSLFLSLTLLATGVSVGAWSYNKMLNVLQASSSVTSFVLSSSAIVASSTHAGHSHGVIQIPSWPALLLAAFSIASKEWLYRITKRIGESLNSQILIANAWYAISYKISRSRY
jgi:divalent metal cation (Fe/Co/Zn/Cd) transporter